MTKHTTPQTLSKKLAQSIHKELEDDSSKLTVWAHLDLTKELAPTPPPKRKRGRPKGSKDSYPRWRTCSKLPPPEITATIMPVIRELIDISDRNGYNRGIGRPNKRAEEESLRTIARLLAAIRIVIDGGSSGSSNSDK